MSISAIASKPITTSSASGDASAIQSLQAQIKSVEGKIKTTAADTKTDAKRKTQELTLLDAQLALLQAQLAEKQADQAKAATASQSSAHVTTVPVATSPTTGRKVNVLV